MNTLLLSLVFDILRYAIGSMFLGVVFTILGVGLLFFLVRGFYPKSTFTPISFFVGTILFVLLAFQSVLICGAFKVKGMSAEIESRINQYIPATWKVLGHEFDAAESQQICDNLGEDYPLFACYVGLADFSGHNVDNIAQAMREEVNRFFYRFIWRRVLWSLLFIIVGTFIVIKTLEIYQTTLRSRGRSAPTPRRSSRQNKFRRR